MKSKHSFLEETEKNKMNIQKIFDRLKIITFIFAILLLLCWLPFPYWYFQLVRFLGLLIFGILALNAFSNDTPNVFIYLVLALLFQPFIKISLGRTLWNIVDTVVAFWLLFNLVKSNKK